MRNLLRAAAPFAAPVAVMAAIFAFSAMPSDGTRHDMLIFAARKVAHFSEYFVLTLAWWWALRTQVGGRRALLPAVAISIGYAMTDELHQTFVDGRTGTPRDVLIDSAGVLTAAWLIRRARTGGREGAAQFPALTEATTHRKTARSSRD